MGTRVGALFVCLLWAQLASAQLAVVPGAPMSPGMQTRGAYACGSNPTIYRVTTLNDSGTGSFRAAVQAVGPRVVIFEVNGYITLASDVNITTPCLVVAGQTAPGPVVVRMVAGSSEAAILVNTHDVLFQHFAIRPGAETCNAGMQIYGGDQQYIVLDHMSFSWGQDENLAFNWTNGQSTDAVVYKSIFAEGLLQAPIPGSPSCTGGGASNGHGILIAASSGRIAVIQSLFASNYERNPYMQGGTNATLVNNVVYQPHGPWGFFFNNGSICGTGCGTNDPWHASVVGYLYIRGPYTCCQGGGDDTVSYQFIYSVNGTDSPNIAGNAIYKSDNTIANQNGTVIPELNGYSYNPVVGSAPSQAPMPTGFTPLASNAIESLVLAQAGARPDPAYRDAVDTRIAAYVAARGGQFIAQPSDVGGYPSLAVNVRVLSPPANAHTVQASGYTALEEWLHGYARLAEGSGGGGGGGGTTGPPNPPTTVHVAAAFHGGATGGSVTQVVVGDDLQALVDAGTTGQVFRIGAGTHRLQSIRPKTGQSFIGDSGAILSGAKVLASADFVSASGYYKISGQTQTIAARTGECQKTIADGYTGTITWPTSYPGCSFQEEVFVDDVAQTRVETLGAMGAGKWFFNDATDEIYVAANPVGHVIETSVTTWAFYQTADNVTISGLTIEKYAAPAQYGAINGEGRAGWNVTGNVIQNNHGCGIRIGNSMTIRSNLITKNGECGVVGIGTGPVLVESNEISYNNRAHFDVSWEGGGTKFVLTTALTVRSNNIHHNEGPGLWTDIDNINTVFEGNIVANNDEMGIIHEISYAAIIRNNTVTNNGLAAWVPNYVFGVGILISASPNVEVYGNTLSGNRGGIAGLQQARGSGGFGAHVITNLNVHNNAVTINRSAGVPTWNGIADDTGSSTIFTSANNHFEANTYTLKTDTNYFIWNNSGDLSFSAWSGIGHDSPVGSATTF